LLLVGAGAAGLAGGEDVAAERDMRLTFLMAIRRYRRIIQHGAAYSGERTKFLMRTIRVFLINTQLALAQM